MKKSTLIIAILLTTSTLVAQNTITGSGTVIAQHRELETFTSVNSPSTVDVTILKNEISCADVKADDNLMEFVLTEVENGVLTISMKRDISYNSPHITVTVYTPHLSEVVMKGTGNVTVLSVKEEHFTLTNKGTGNFKSDCLVVEKDLILQNSGTGNIDVSYMCPNSVTIQNSGTGNINMSMIQNVTSSMKIQNSGTGDITLKKLSVGYLQLKSLGTGNVTLSGKADNMTLVNGGCGNVRANNLKVATAHITHASVGNIIATVTGTAYLTDKSELGKVTIHGGGKIVRE
jgi:predicted small secreted protein